ncbi:MAG: phage portal protein [Sphingomonas sp.]|nr:MAG: phage portal protein [Sphingomonas sp.]
MLDGIRSKLARAIAPTGLALRKIDSGSFAPRTQGFGVFGRTQPEVSAAATVTRSRARYLATSNPWIANAVGNWTGALIGAGITPTGSPDDVANFLAWGRSADFDGRTDFNGLLVEIARAMVVDGESFIRLHFGLTGLKLQILPAEMVDESRTAELANGGYVVQGVEFDATGQRVAYHVLPHRPTDQFSRFTSPIRVPAAEILHVFRPIGAGQVRGISWLAPIVVPASEFDAIVDALAVGIKISALHAGFIVDQNGTGGAFDDADGDGEMSMEPGTVRRLPAGTDIRFSSPEQAKDIGPFLSFQLRQLAAGLGLPSHMVDGDLSQANYSSLRAGLLPFRTRVEQVQYSVLVPQLLDPVWARVTLAPPPEWLPPAFMQVDPAKQVEADVAEIEAGLASRRQKIAERGWNADALDAEIAADRARESALGLSFGTAPAAAESPSTEQQEQPPHD